MVFGGFSDVVLSTGAVVSVCDRLAREEGVFHGFTTRLGGVSRGDFAALDLSFGRGDEDDAVAENLRRVAAGLGVPGGRFVFTRQVHGAEIRTVTEEDLRDPAPGPVPPACDGLVTDRRGVALMGKNADCVPLLFYCPAPRLAAFAHAGWRGTAADIAGKTVERLAALGARPADLIVAVGPAIGPCCFLTHADVTDALAVLPAGALRDAVRPAPDGRFSVDLKRINAALAEARGVGQVFLSPDCTCCLSDKYYSHRRTGDRRGSMAAVIGLR